MSLQDRFASQDPLSLLSGAATLSLITAASQAALAYNLPVVFLILIPLTIILDFYAILFRQLSILTWIVTLLLALLKAPLFFSCLAQLRERGGELNFEGWRGIGGFNRLGGQNSWGMPANMPGAFSDNQPSAAAAPAQPTFPSSGGFRLGGDEEQGEGHPTGAPGRNGYQTIG
ncbi:hypothetical protein I309_03744 [Cryptococcus deuterogattii LA55]|nr:hypothetical protein I309_03744 [Cryptococcus deuterogattii LA55]KIR36089.1 hypothetical protein I352_01033 [Cryptococcus deuterogattii MMRL2647]KIR75522.1 hypothetical protein I310_00215 [Cryptococcus deuterogattii CA1014]KIR95462.1 hypothetical protein I304_00213 [Cryptococcus deuterogattii CBS 10090]